MTSQSLAALLPTDAERSEVPEDLEELNPYSVATRYPGPWEPLDREDAERAVDMALAVRAAVRSRLPSEVLRVSGED